MQKKQWKNLKENIDKTQRIFRNKKEKKEYLGGENYQKDLWQESYIDEQIRGIIKSTGQDQKGIGDTRRKD